MEIKKFVKKKNNVYELELDDGNHLKLYDDVIIKYNLLINKKLDNKLLNEITEYNDSLDAYYLSIKYLGSKLRCEKEIRAYLNKKNFDSIIIDKTINKLTKEGYLDHKNYINSYINDTFNFTNYGPNKMKYNLLKLGFNEDEIELFLNKDFSIKIDNIINKKVKLNNKLSTNALKIYINNYLVNLGYPKEMFIDKLMAIHGDNKKMILKDYQLLMKKYQKKYDKEKLDYFIKDKLYKKGYNIDEINEVVQ